MIFVVVATAVLLATVSGSDVGKGDCVCVETKNKCGESISVILPSHVIIHGAVGRT